MKKRLWQLSCSMAMGFSSFASAAAITFVNSGTPDTSTLDAWRTSSVVKPLDVDGNNVYGSDGYYMAGAAGVATPNYVQSIAPASLYGGDPSYAGIDNPANVPNNVTSGLIVRSNTFGTVISFTMSSSLVGTKSFRVGILDNNQGHLTLDSSGLTPDFIAVNQTAGGSASSGTLDSSGTPTPNLAQPHYIFFDVTGAVANDAFAINVSSDGAPFAQAGIGGLTFDALPEPASLGMLGMAAMIILRRQRAN